MAGLLRNLITLLLSLPCYGRLPVAGNFSRRFLVTPLDIGTHRLKSDRYLQLAECAQLDFIIRGGLLGSMLKNGYSFVNAAQLIGFRRPVSVFSRVQVDTRVLWFDERWVYFRHEFQAGGQPCASVLVKMKFKKGRQTVNPGLLLGRPSQSRPNLLDAWDASLDALH